MHNSLESVNYGSETLKQMSGLTRAEILSVTALAIGLLVMTTARAF